MATIGHTEAPERFTRKALTVRRITRTMAATTLIVAIALNVTACAPSTPPAAKYPVSDPLVAFASKDPSASKPALHAQGDGTTTFKLDLASTLHPLQVMVTCTGTGNYTVKVGNPHGLFRHVFEPCHAHSAPGILVPVTGMPNNTVATVTVAKGVKFWIAAVSVSALNK